MSEFVLCPGCGACLCVVDGDAPPHDCRETPQ